MSDLSKQQLILLALLVSFVTSLSTGIVTVSLMDQAPASVTQTVGQVIEKTIEQAVPQGAAVGTISVEDQLANAVSQVTQSLIKLESTGGGVTGVGSIVSADGVIIADKAALTGTLTQAVSPASAASNATLAIMPGGSSVPIAVIQSQVNGDIVFLKAIATGTSAAPNLTPVTFSAVPRLGEAVFALSGTSTPMLEQGIVTALDQNASSTTASSVASSEPYAQIVSTSLDGTALSFGTILFDADGKAVGIHTSSLKASPSATDFTLLAPLQAVIPVVQP